MGWTPISLPLDVQSAAFLNEYVDAINERADAVGAENVDAVEVDDYIQFASLVAGWQAKIEALATSFVNSADYPGGFDGETDVEMYTLATFRAAAGIPDGFRRATAWPTDWTAYDDAAFSYGQMQAGDITLAPWLFKDLQNALNIMIWTADAAQTWTASGEDNWNECFDGSVAGWAESKSLAEAQFASGVNLCSTDLSPRAVSFGAYHDGSWGAQAQRCRSYRAWARPLDRTADADFYIRTAKYTCQDTNVWDGNGDIPAGYENLVYRWRQETGITGLSGKSGAMLGALSQPVWCAEPVVGNSKSAGYYCTAQGDVVVFKWNVVGGFEYTA